MKRLILSLVAIATISLSSFGQSPEGFKYQAVVRDAGNLILNNQTVGMQMTIQQGSIGGVTVYQETFAPTTNGYGLVNLEIGTGTTTDDFTTIDWTAGPYFIETAVDITGGTSYAVMGTSQLMSVPYALYAKTSGNGQGPIGPAGTNGTDGVDGIDGATGPQGPAGADGQGGVTTAGTNVTITGTGTSLAPYVVNAASGPFYLGKDTLGGIVYYIYVGSDGLQHGLIVSKTESTAIWQAIGTFTNAQYSEDGALNTALMTSSAAATYVTGLGAGWYLPSIDELGLLYYSRFSSNKALRAGATNTLLSYAIYWSSTETAINLAYGFHFGFGSTDFSYYKDAAYLVRAVRAF